MTAHASWIFAGLCLLSFPGAAQQQVPIWAQMPRMQLERQYAGPLQDTIIQRWRDPVDGTICYIYLPITAAHTPPTQSGYVQYGPNTIGSITCIVAPGSTATPTAGQRKAAPPPRPSTPSPAPTPPAPPQQR